MCGTPFPHRPLTVPEAQSTLTFTSAPLEIAPSPLHGRVEPSPPEPPLESAQVEEILSAPAEIAASEPIAVFEPSPPETTTGHPHELAVRSLHAVTEEAEPLVASAAEPAAATPPPAEVPFAESEPIVEVEEPLTPPQTQVLADGPAPFVEATELATGPEAIPVETSEPEPSPARAEPVCETEPSHPIAAPVYTPPTFAEPDEAPAPVPQAVEPVPAPHEAPPPLEGPHVAVFAASAPVIEPSAPTPSAAEPAPEAPEAPHTEAPPQPPEISRWKPHLVTPPVPVPLQASPARTGASTRTPAVIHPSPDSLPMTPPPASAGMPTFQSVVDASGAPPVSPFEPPVEKHPDEERELREFVANFRYQAPEESFDELTMRSEVPVLDAEAPVTPSHPSFDDDVPPPPEAGPHPTGQEYYPPAEASSDRTRFLEIADSSHVGQRPQTSRFSSTSILGLDGPLPDTAPPDELARPARPRWFLWSSVAVLVAIFGALGFLEGRAEMNHAYPEPIAVIREQYAKLRQRASQIMASAPAAPAESPIAEAPAKTAPEAQSAPPSQPASKSQPVPAESATPAASPATQSSAAPDQQPPKPAPDAIAASPQPAKGPPPAAAKPKSKPAPGQQELANAMRASDPAAAAAWLWKATSRGNPEAPVRLADMYIKGNGVPRSCEQALVLLRSQASKDDAPARNRLAALYANGTCVARDRVKAYQLMSSALAVDPGSEWAEQNRQQLWQQMTPQERAQAEKYR